MNRLLSLASGDVVLFIDDDVVPDSRLIEAHRANYATSNPDGPWDAVAGGVDQFSFPMAPSTVAQVGRYDRWTGALRTGFNARVRGPVDFAQGCNMSFRREVLCAAGGFDTGFLGNAYFFETEACLRVTRRGGRMVFDPTARLQHLQSPVGGARVSDKALHTAHFVRNGLRLYRRHSPRMGLVGFAASRLGYVAAKAVYNRNFAILQCGLAAIRDGLTQDMTLGREGF
jgi:GT2 family glycosyltransferase